MNNFKSAPLLLMPFVSQEVPALLYGIVWAQLMFIAGINSHTHTCTHTHTCIMYIHNHTHTYTTHTHTQHTHTHTHTHTYTTHTHMHRFLHSLLQLHHHISQPSTSGPDTATGPSLPATLLPKQLVAEALYNIARPLVHSKITLLSRLLLDITTMS